mmetsp:Transcript_42864/g.124635  ORF Transcript_42864/g.124635 Transcript_42864/m.124635 type:complete len:216 (-) Transcript_42864:308-955(-)
MERRVILGRASGGRANSTKARARRAKARGKAKIGISRRGTGGRIGIPLPLPRLPAAAQSFSMLWRQRRSQCPWPPWSPIACRSKRPSADPSGSKRRSDNCEEFAGTSRKVSASTAIVANTSMSARLQQPAQPLWHRRLPYTTQVDWRWRLRLPRLPRRRRPLGGRYLQHWRIAHAPGRGRRLCRGRLAMVGGPRTSGLRTSFHHATAGTASCASC